jgi:NADH:ubiquinone oxidoreductase subunit F (NADH-binding)/NADH:ubiquinone oxidoreductase subunit E
MLRERLEKYPRERTWLLPALLDVQRVERWLSSDSLTQVAEHLRIAPDEVRDVAAHYPALRLEEPGRRVVRVCAGVSCRVRGAAALAQTFERRLGVGVGETSADGEVTLETVDCAFACAVAPVVQIDQRWHGRVDPGDVEGLLASVPARVAASASAGIPPSPLPSAGSPGARFTQLKREAERRRTGARLAVGLGTCGLAVGAADTHRVLREECERRQLPFSVVAAGCNGMCWAAPVVEVLRDGRPRLTVGPVPPHGVARMLNALAANVAVHELHAGAEFMEPQRRVLLARCGLADPGDIADALRHGTYEALATALEDGRPGRVIEEVRAAALAGRGGGYLHTATKWAAARLVPGTAKVVVVNGEEGEPGSFKDRHLMEGDPHRLLEAALLAAFAVGASRGILYIHGEADLAAERVVVALEQARAWGFVGPGILGSEFSLELEVRRGAGGFVLGEETALLESIEGRRALPRDRPPLPAEVGLEGRPTIVDNVETLFAVPAIVQRGGAWFAALGRGRGTKLFALSGDVARPGVAELELGCTLETLLEEIGGGSASGRPVRGAVIGGPAGEIVPPRAFDEPLDPRGPVSPRTGSVIALTTEDAIRDAVRTLLAFNARESCGKCPACREGTARLLAMLDGPIDPARVRALAAEIQAASLCGLGQTAPLSLLSALAAFPEAMGAT